VRYGSAADLGGQIQDRLLDAFLFATGVPAPAFSELEVQADVNYLDFTEEEVAKLTQQFPELAAGTLPMGTYRKQEKPLRIVGMYNFAIVHRSLPEDLVYEITKSVLGQNARCARRSRRVGDAGGELDEEQLPALPPRRRPLPARGRAARAGQPRDGVNRRE
jgi:TRAP transporter TAXI family solute receptor